jgi:hypothetical protein
MCDCKSASEEKSSATSISVKRKVSERALKLALSLPDDVTLGKQFANQEAAFLSSLRNLASSFSMAHLWSDEEAAARHDGFALADASITLTVAAARANGGGGNGPSCTARCTAEKDSCRGSCDASPGAGYFCYFDCRLSYFACLASCITVGGGLSGLGISIA